VKGGEGKVSRGGCFYGGTFRLSRASEEERGVRGLSPKALCVE